MAHLSSSGLQAFHYAELRRDPEALARAVGMAKPGTEHERILLGIQIERATKEIAEAAEAEQERARQRLEALVEKRRALAQKLYPAE